MRVLKTYLVIVEVSQKQAYIFASNKLRDNIKNSDIIAYVTSDAYFKDCTRGIQANGKNLYIESANLVYSGGGHAVLEFSDRESAKQFIYQVTLKAKSDYPDLELFATIYECEGEPSAKSISALQDKLEEKKALRRASFSQGTFGVEEINSTTRDAEPLGEDGKIFITDFPPESDKADREAYPDGFERAFDFEDLGGSKEESNFIAVVHIDGNGMGKRLENLAEKFGNAPWGEYRKTLKDFSDSVASDFRDAFKEMCLCVAANVNDGKLGDITLKKNKNGKPYLPVRRIITEGDDICFVTEGRIGVECARVFMEIVNSKTNAVDKKKYGVCAGVAIVHQKYPFYRAYELAEMLCSNAKKFVANSIKDIKGAESADLCAIDWHLEFGEMEDGIEDIRRKYITSDNKRMELRPYVVCGSGECMKKEEARNYSNFRKVMQIVDSNADEYARGKLKGLRNIIPEGETAAWNYLKANRIEGLAMNCYTGIYIDIDIDRVGTGNGQDSSLFIQTADGEDRSILFDAIESSDTFIPLNT